MSATWHTVAVAHQWAVSGGFLSKPVTLETKEVVTLAGVEHFVKVDKKAEWLLKAAVGKSNKGGLKRTGLCESIKEKVTQSAKSASSSDDSQSSSVAEPATEDPMDMLEDDFSAPAPAKKPRKVYTSLRRSNTITHIDMPEHEPTAHPGTTATRSVAVLPFSTNQMWLAVEDVPWLVKWLADEVRSGGVAMDTEDPLDGLECNCAAENVHIRWDFSRAWEAIRIAGEKKGTMIKSSVDKFTAEKWLAVDGPTMYGCAFENATEEQLRTATFRYLEKHMQEVEPP